MLEKPNLQDQDLIACLRDGYEVALSERQWVELGTTLKSIHTAAVDPALKERIPRETYSPRWRESAKRFVERAEDEVFDDPVSSRLAAFLTARREEILDLVGRAEGFTQDRSSLPSVCSEHPAPDLVDLRH